MRIVTRYSLVDQIAINDPGYYIIKEEAAGDIDHRRLTCCILASNLQGSSQEAQVDGQVQGRKGMEDGDNTGLDGG